MFARSIPRGVVKRRRRVLPAERPVIADVSPAAASFDLALRQDRNRGVVAMQALGSKDVRFDQRIERPQRQSAGPDQVGQRR